MMMGMAMSMERTISHERIVWWAGDLVIWNFGGRRGEFLEVGVSGKNSL